VEALNISAEGLELFDDAVVAAVNVVHAIDYGFAFGHQCREY
jgi:hypothetical protein